MLGLQLSGISHTNFLFSLFVRNGEKDWPAGSHRPQWLERSALRRG
jgi:hypothetical protein